MKNITVALFFLALMSACSSGTSVSEVPPQVTSSTYSGTFITSNSLGTGDIQLDLTDNGSGGISGNLIISNTFPAACICSSEITGTQTGFDLILQTGDCTVTQNPTSCDTPTEITDDLGNVVDSFCPEEDFTGPAQITLTSNSSESFSGTFVVSGNVCLAPLFAPINNIRTGSITLDRS